VGVLLAATHCGGERIALGDGPVEALTATGTRRDPDAGVTSGGGLAGSGGAADASVPGGLGGLGGLGGAGGAEADGATPLAACLLGGVPAEEVLWIGDSWFTLPAELQRTLVVESARDAGLIASTDDYPSRAAAASSLSMIVEQYRSQRAGGPAPQVLIMDGGTWDTLRANGSAESVSQVLLGFEAFLAEVASDGTVGHVVYMLMPELPAIAGVNELRPGLLAACEQSAVPCHFLDLQPIWDGHPEYTADGIQASEEGAARIAEEIWKIAGAACPRP
jgi:hypothetical protein